jgi:hypothetical protein
VPEVKIPERTPDILFEKGLRKKLRYSLRERAEMLALTYWPAIFLK